LTRHAARWPGGQAPPAALLTLLPRLLEGAEFAAARLIVASLTRTSTGCRPPWRRVMIASAPLWAVAGGCGAAAVFTVVAVAADALLGARAAGRRVTGAALAPLAEVLRRWPRSGGTTPAADKLLWRLGLAVVPVAGVLSAVVDPVRRRDCEPDDRRGGLVQRDGGGHLGGAVAGGLGPNAVLSLVGGYRFVAQGLAYELPLMFALISAAAGAQSLKRRGHRRRAARASVVRCVDAGRVRRLPGQRVRVQLPRPFGYPAGRTWPEACWLSCPGRTGWCSRQAGGCC